MKLNARTISKISKQLEKGEITEEQALELLKSLVKGESK